MEEIGNILPKAIQKHVLRGRQPLAAMLAPLWPRVVGKFIGNFSTPAAFEDGVLTIAASSPSWVSQLRGMEDPIRAQVNSSLGAPVVKKLHFRLDGSNRRDANQNSAAALPAEADNLETVVKPLAHPSTFPWAERGVHLSPEVAEVLERSFTKYFSRPVKGPVA